LPVDQKGRNVEQNDGKNSNVRSIAKEASPSAAVFDFPLVKEVVFYSISVWLDGRF